MADQEVVLQALSVLCNANVTSLQSIESQRASSNSRKARTGLIPALMGGGFASCVARHIWDTPSSSSRMATTTFIPTLMGCSFPSGWTHIIDEEEFFDRQYDYDFTDLKDTETFYRGGEVYERPCGWKRYALKVLDKYPDGNTWLGERGHCTGTKSKTGEWPVSYHGTSKKGAQGIIVANYEPGTGEYYGRGIYSTPYISEAVHYTKTFTSATKRKRYHVLLQNRVNPENRQKHNNGKYWLVPLSEGLSKEQEQAIVENAIRPYALLLKPL